LIDEGMRVNDNGNGALIFGALPLRDITNLRLMAIDEDV
jgi:hypothetical protein